MSSEKNLAALQSTLSELASLRIKPSRLRIINDSTVGAGAFGDVYLAMLDRKLKVAVKELKVKHASGKDTRAALRFARELKVWAKIQHPNVLKLVGYYLSKDYRCAQLISLYMENGNIVEYMRRTPTGIETRLGFVQGITFGVRYLHEHYPPICHGDLKPLNVLINDKPDAVLCDFGVATLVEESGVSTGLSTNGPTKGTRRYMSPELLDSENSKHTLKSDIWAWACTVFEIITERIPYANFQGDNSVFLAISRGDLPGSVELLAGQAPALDAVARVKLVALQALIQESWQIEPVERPSSPDIIKRLGITDPAYLDPTQRSGDHREIDGLAITGFTTPELSNQQRNRLSEWIYRRIKYKSQIADGLVSNEAPEPDVLSLSTGIAKPKPQSSVTDTETNSALQRTLDELAYLFIKPSQLNILNDSEIGSGGYSQVFFATLDGSTKVAVKQLRIPRTEQWPSIRVAMRLARELRVWAKVKHPNVLKLVGYYLSENYGCAQFVSPYMPNGNITDYMERTQPGAEARLEFVRGITSGMDYLHSCDPPICHGDPKPGNVLINDAFEAVLCDFGVATFVEDSGDPSGLTTSEIAPRTDRYMGPELLGDTKHTLEGDVWTWACTTFEVLRQVLQSYVPLDTRALDYRSSQTAGHNLLKLILPAFFTLSLKGLRPRRWNC